MIVLKTSHELSLMREACRISAGALKVAGEAVEPGVTTAQIDKIAHEYILKAGATPTFLNYNGFPATACISINDEIIHGIPSHRRIIKSGDIVSIDLGASINGYTGDNAATFACGDISPEAKRLCDVTRESLYEGISKAVAGGRLGVGANLHEDPSVPNFGTPGRGVRLLPGMTIAIEPMINQGAAAIRTQPDGWTVRTKDGKLSAHFEHTVAITADGPKIMTQL